MRSFVAATVAVLAAFAGSPSSAQPASYDECLQTTLEVKTYLRVMQSCSDAYWVRRDPGEADALCAAAWALTEQHGDRLAHQIDLAKGAEGAETRCAKDMVLPMMGAYMKAHDWSLAYTQLRIDGRGEAVFQPLKVIRFEGEH